MERKLLKQVILEQKKARGSAIRDIERECLQEIESYVKLDHVVIITGVRRSGKSTLLKQILHKYYGDDLYYIDFEDERLLDFTVADFNTLYEVFIELYDLKNIFFFDEIQIIPEWELFVRRMHREKNKFFITGSNASLLSSELSTRLTGRHVTIELLPFSFREFLRYFRKDYSEESFLLSQEKAQLKRSFNEYLEHGGMPEYLEHRNPVVLQSVYENILFKDVIVRYQIKAVKAMRELSLYLLSNTGSLISYTNLKNILDLGSLNTVKDFVHYLQNAYLIFTLERFSYSVAEQTTAQKKVYAVDLGFVRHVAFQFSKNLGKYLENIVYLELRRRFKDLYYYRTKNNLEVDFLVRRGTTAVALIQVTQSLSNADTREREIRALSVAMKELDIATGLVLTLDEEETLDVDAGEIQVMPIYRWLLEEQDNPPLR